jgi:hypothetical protein
MGWNDRLPEDPFIPSDAYYREREEYEAWLDYVEAKLREEDTGLSSQNIDPATLAGRKDTQQETPARPGFVSRLMAQFFGKEVPKNEQQENSRTDEEVPF